MEKRESVAETLRSLRQLREKSIELLRELGHTDIADRLGESKREQRALTFPLRPTEQRQLRMAAVMDRFTRDCYAPECCLLEVTPGAWREEMDAFKPDLLFLESAWQGKDGLWYRKLSHGSPELSAMTHYCRKQGIPIVFWNKEDPVYTDTFMPAAALADVVFTTDMDCIPRYQRSLEHQRVYHLHFAAQPALHNPVEKYQRQDRFCFAGAYYHRYPQRARVFDAFAERMRAGKGLDIYDRNFGHARPEHAFPPVYAPCILGSLDPSEIDRAYKGYNYSVNMNSVSQSQTMFARRVFETLASDTVTVGNFSRGVKNYFGQLTICTDDVETLDKQLALFCGDGLTARKYRLLGLRQVLREHLYEDRLDYIVQKVFGKSIKQPLPPITVLARAHTGAEAGRVVAAFARQSYGDKRLLLFTDVETPDLPQGGERLPLSALAEPVSRRVFEGCTAVFSPEDWYGENYLLDLALTLRYGKYEAVGKAEYFSMENGVVTVPTAAGRFRPAAALAAWRSLAGLERSGALTAEAYLGGEFRQADGLFFADEFNYCAGCQAETCPEAADLPLAERGMSAQAIRATAEGIDALSQDDASLTATELKRESILQAVVPAGAQVTLRAEGEQLRVEARLQPEAHCNLYIPVFYALRSVVTGDKLSMRLRSAGELDLRGFAVFFGRDRKKLKTVSLVPGRVTVEALPPGAETVQFGLRVAGSGESLLRGLSFGDELPPESVSFLTGADTLVLTNQYPSYASLYRNAFVHQRVSAYMKRGLSPLVLRMAPGAQAGFREFDGVGVVEGRADTLSSILDSGAVKTVCVHFLDEQMWSVLRERLDSLRLLVWVHGAEIQPWWRREYNFGSDAELEAGKAASEKRQAFWQQVFATVAGRDNVRFIFVSRYFAGEVMEDYQLTLPRELYRVIHNCIDTDVFRYEVKPPAQRKRVLSIKPYASRKYATDVITAAIVALSKEPCFRDMEFDLYGQGKLFQQDTAPLAGFENVHLHEQFLTHAEIAALHRQYGVYLAMTRMDAQGVSRDEAMSSGMVPIASSVTAIPEFVDDDCGILVPGEDPQAVADAMKRLYDDPALFTRLSAAAAARVRRQTSAPYTVDRELALILGKESET